MGWIEWQVPASTPTHSHRENPLGMGGVMAKRYGELLHDLWNGSSKSITPLKFRVSSQGLVPRQSSMLAAGPCSETKLWTC